MTTAGGGWTVVSSIGSSNTFARVVTGPVASKDPFKDENSYSLSLKQKSALSLISQVTCFVLFAVV